jgi:hypothetical protein
MESVALLDRAGRRRSPATTSSFHQSLPPRNKGRRYPPDPPGHGYTGASRRPSHWGTLRAWGSTARLDPVPPRDHCSS